MRREVAGAGGGGGEGLDEHRKSDPDLQAELMKVLGEEEAWRLFAVEASIRPTYEAFPKNAAGRLPPQEIVPAIVRNYFAKEHGWLLRGLEPPSVRLEATKVHEAAVLQARAPALAEALRVLHSSDRGFSLSDVVGVIAALEHLIVTESQHILNAAYSLNEHSTDDALDDGALHEVLLSYLLLFRWGEPAAQNLTDVRGHQALKARARQAPDWQELVGFVTSAVGASSGRSAAPHPVASVRRLVAELAQKYGKFQDAECMDMKETLVDLARDREGMVPFEAFHAEPSHASFQFTEKPSYLLKTGALWVPPTSGPWPDKDGEAPEGSQVLIANYLLGPSNCIAPSQFHSVCCLNECEGVMSSIEERAKAPMVPAERLRTLMGQVGSSSVGEARPLRPSLGHDLHTIAGRHEGAVPLHSPDFRQFLHDAFPNECPLPTASDRAAEASELTAAKAWLDIQEECTRVPEWHPSLHRGSSGAGEGDAEEGEASRRPQQPQQPLEEAAAGAEAEEPVVVRV